MKLPLTGPPLLIALLGLLGCAYRHQVSEPTPLETFDAIGREEGAKYLIQPGDQLEVRFFHTPEQNAIFPVRPDGFISLPLAPEVRAAGRTAEELRVALQAAYDSELRDPQLAVLVLTFSGFKIHVGGEVAQPGVFDLVDGRNVMEAIFGAGGMLPSASPRDVVVVRRDGEGYAVTQLDLTGTLDGTDSSQNLTLRPYDLVFVPRSRIGNVNNWVEVYLRRNIPINLGWAIQR